MATQTGACFAFPKAMRLRKREDYARLRRRGHKRHRPHFIIYYLENAEGPPRLGLTVSRKVGGAVQRNRVKRLVREYFRLHARQIGRGIEISIIAKRGSSDLALDDVTRQLDFLTGLNDCQDTSNGQADTSISH